MSRTWRFNGSGGVLVLLRASDARATHEAHRWPREKAMRFVEGLADEATPLRRVLASVAHDLAGSVPGGGAADTRALKGAVVRWLQAGRLIALHYPFRPDVVAPGEAQEGDDALPEDLIKTWIELRLIDEAGAPVAGAAYRIELPDGRLRTGATNQQGVAREDNLDPGTCQVSFPDLHGPDWTRA